MPVATLALIASCSWAHPGANRFTGDPAAAIDHYSDIPSADRIRLKELLASKSYDTLVTITRDSVSSDFGPLFDMHFGANKLCHEVDRSAWTEGQTERAMIFCSTDYCVALPTVCGNLSRVNRQPKLRAMAARVEPIQREAIALEPAPVLSLEPMPLETDAPETLTLGAPSMKLISFDSSINRLVTVYVPPLPPAPPIPEPPSWYMLAAGIGLIALRKRRG
jgi:hypothetical protein